MNALPYHELKAAQALFQKQPADLNPAERDKVAAVSRRYQEIESVVLASPEAIGACLAEGQLEAALAEIRGRYADEEGFSAALATMSLTPDSYAAALSRDLLVETVLERVGAQAEIIGDTEAEIFYLTHVERFHTPEKRTVRHILITINEDIADNRREAASRRAQEIARRLANKPERFEEQAGKHSECPTALNGGLLGEVPRGQLFPELDAALFEMKVMQISGVLESEIGFHILRCDAIRPEHTPAYAEVADKLKQRLNEERSRRHARNWLAARLAPARQAAA